MAIEFHSDILHSVTEIIHGHQSEIHVISVFSHKEYAFSADAVYMGEVAGHPEICIFTLKVIELIQIFAVKDDHLFALEFQVLRAEFVSVRGDSL